MDPILDRPIKLTIHSCPGQLPVVRAALQRVCELVGFGDEAAGAIVLSVDEALTNIIKHAYQGAIDRTIEITLSAIGAERRTEALQVELRDFGRYVPREQIRSRDLDDVRPGGLGVHIIAECMDCVDYAPAEGGGTLLTLIKKLPARQEASK